MGRFTNWLERRWVNPAYVGWVLLGLAVFFFAAATNTLAGWLYVMSGVLLALLVVAAILPPKNLRGLTVQRLPSEAVSAGEPLLIELQILNPQRHSTGAMQVMDRPAQELGPIQQHALQTISPGQTYTWRYRLSTHRRGIYRWSTVVLRSAAPLGLFWCRRELAVPATVVVYPQVLPLQRCPILDTLANQTGQHRQSLRSRMSTTDGMTRSLRPYRWGDSTRLIHWRTSARYGDLRVRELESLAAGQEVMIAIDTSQHWNAEHFEQAVVAAASLFTYATQRGLVVTLWQRPDDVLHDRRSILYALAGLAPYQSQPTYPKQNQIPTIWLGAQQAPAKALTASSRQVIWNHQPTLNSVEGHPGTLWIEANQSLQQQLQRPLQNS
ncbi:MAG: DUF58 domain-containing protein [Leptolyngbyaceae cyanobacterium SM2_5_2]|nr:DUF58 domain-containing protein [Leptolyngbyaceae cyanobacterium SM2_5_2]